MAHRPSDSTALLREEYRPKDEMAGALPDIRLLCSARLRVRYAKSTHLLQSTTADKSVRRCCRLG